MFQVFYSAEISLTVLTVDVILSTFVKCPNDTLPSASVLKAVVNYSLILFSLIVIDISIPNLGSPFLPNK